MDIINEIKDAYRKGNVYIRLIFINIAVFLAVNLVRLVYFLFFPQSYFGLAEWLAVPSGLGSLIYRPWSIFTYMFLHLDFFHILFNMLWLFWFAQIFLIYFDQKKLLGCYILGGLSGAILYILAFNIFPAFQAMVQNSVALGASASVLAIVIAVSAYAPDYTINLMFFGPVKLKYIALITILIDVISIPAGNAGGHIAHIGGAIFGFIFALQLKKGKDITKTFNGWMDTVFAWIKPGSKMKIKYQAPKAAKSDLDYNKTKSDNMAEIDRILEKIKRNGYESLSKDEKNILFKASDKDKK